MCCVVFNDSRAGNEHKQETTLNASAFANERRFWHFFDIADGAGTRNGVCEGPH